ncbi:Ulp1 protease family protein [Colletotrichum truncatum]|uniref:Ulp1 protease family protein n=1 Tax=Colletotrichum truncatum TaxID=5467 RepID=A0ACC3YBM7_COLTU|nr:Ulp1 protease family protein [Colletotrichum truncatum]KAF6781454.1 Ulp1 protease family protein [Colletotrichum truncatum]
MLQSTLASLNLLADPGFRQIDPILELWKQLRQDFDANIADARRTVDDDSFSAFVLKQVNRAVLKAALDLDLADTLGKIDESVISAEAHYRLSATLDRWSVSKSIFVFLFGTEVALSRVTHEALKNLHQNLSHPDIIQLYEAFERTAPSLQARGTRGKANRKNRKAVDRLKEAVVSLCPNAWPKRERPSKPASEKPVQDDDDSDKASSVVSKNEEIASRNGREHVDRLVVDDDFFADRDSDGSEADVPYLNDRDSDDSDADVPNLNKRNTDDGNVNVRNSNVLTRTHLPASFDHDLSTIIEESAVWQQELGASPVPLATAPPKFTLPKANPEQSALFESASVDAVANADVDIGFRLDPNITARKHRRSSAQAKPVTPRKRIKTEGQRLSPEALDFDSSFHFKKKSSQRETCPESFESPEVGRSQFPALDDSLLSQKSDILQSPKDESLAKSLQRLSRPSDSQTSLFSPTSLKQASSLQHNSLVTPSDASTAIEMQSMSTPILDDTAWLSGTVVAQCLSIITMSAGERQPGEPCWLLIDSLTTGSQAKLSQSTYVTMSRSASPCILPLFHNKHWVLAIMRRDRMASIEVDLYDSLESKAHTETSYEQLEVFCDRYIAKSTRLPGYIANIPCAQQTNTNDCGVYVIAFAAHIVSQKTLLAFDTRLWRIIIHIMRELSYPPPEQPIAAKEDLRRLFLAKYLNESQLALPRFPIQLPELKTEATHDGSVCNINELDDFAAHVVEAQRRLRADTARAVRSRLSTWTAAHRHLMRTCSALERLAEMATATSAAADANIKKKELETQQHQDFTSKNEVDAATQREFDQAVRELRQARKQAEEIRACVNVWTFLVQIIEEARATLEERLSMTQLE